MTVSREFDQVACSQPESSSRCDDFSTVQVSLDRVSKFSGDENPGIVAFTEIPLSEGFGQYLPDIKITGKNLVIQVMSGIIHDAYPYIADTSIDIQVT